MHWQPEMIINQLRKASQLLKIYWEFLERCLLKLIVVSVTTAGPPFPSPSSFLHLSAPLESYSFLTLNPCSVSFLLTRLTGDAAFREERVILTLTDNKEVLLPFNCAHLFQTGTWQVFTNLEKKGHGAMTHELQKNIVYLDNRCILSAHFCTCSEYRISCQTQNKPCDPFTPRNAWRT